jgi:hypothetical protein
MRFRLVKEVNMSMVIVLALLFTILDSGGEKNMQLIAIGIIFTLGIGEIRKSSAISNILFYLALVLLLTLSSLRSIISGVDPRSIVAWVAPLLSLPLLVFFCRSGDVRSNHFIAAGAIFAVIVVLLFIGRLTAIPVLMELNELLTSGASGFFNYKQAFFSDELPVVYFQGTLSLVFIGVLAWGCGNRLVFLIALIALIAAPSRFGVAVLCMLAILYSLSKFMKFRFFPISLSLFVFTVIGLTALATIQWYSVDSVFLGEIDSVREGHLISITKEINEDPSQLITGAGPGSKFYSSGFGEFTDNIEISQLELLRKYGLVFFIFIHLFAVGLIYKLYRLGMYAEIYAVISHYIVSLSNPVLTSIPFLLFLGYLIKVVSENDRKKNKQTLVI